MTVFAYTWNATFEAVPADTENIAPGAGEIRDFKKAVHERLAVDHSWGGDSSDGVHLRLSLAVGTANIASADPATFPSLFSKFVGGFSELCFTNLSAQTVQLTRAGSLNATGGGATGFRPINPQIGFVYLDTTLGKPVFFQGGGWVDATGAIV